MRKDSNGREVFPPADYIEGEMEARGWGIFALVRHSGISDLDWRIWFANNDPVTAVVAEGLSRAFGTGPEVWLNLQATWDDAREC